MIRQRPDERLGSVAAAKMEIQKFEAEAVSLQKLRQLDKVVVPAGEVTDPLAHAPPTIIGAEWNGGTLTITLDQKVNPDWIEALNKMGNYSSVMGRGPETFQFAGDKAMVSIDDGSAQDVLDHFKVWLPKTTAVLKYRLEQRARHDEATRIESLRRQREAEERLLRVNRSLKF